LRSACTVTEVTFCALTTCIASGLSRRLGVPWVADPNVPDSNVGSGTLNTDVFMLNEDYIHWCISPRGDMFVTDFQEGLTQDAMAAKILWAGNLVVTNRARQAKATGLNVPA